MIIDTSALIAVLKAESGFENLRDALIDPDGLIPAPVIVEYERVSSLIRNLPDPKAAALLDVLTLAGVRVLPLTAEAAAAAAAANFVYGSGNGNGGALNILDLMVYGVAKVTGLPILCTGKDFAATGVTLHPASRRW